jgi:phosphotransferase system HPr (HPr) family protein
MYEKSVTIKINTGVHARPAAEMVKLSNKFISEVFIVKGDTEVNGKSIMGIMMLAISRGTEILIRANGTDEKELVDALVELINNNFELHTEKMA